MMRTSGIRPSTCAPEADRTFFTTIKRMCRSMSMGFIFVVLTVYVACFLSVDRHDATIDTLKGKFSFLKKLALKCKQLSIARFTSKTKVDEDAIDNTMIERVITEEIARFDVDRTGMTDYAMKPLGGGIVTIFNTVPFAFEQSGILGFPLQRKISDPSAILEPSTLPGDCWAFSGQKGAVAIRLFTQIVVTHVTMEHVPRGTAQAGDVYSAPRIFSVLGLQDPYSAQGHAFGSYVYKRNGPAVQTFPVLNGCQEPFIFVRIDFQENHGNDNFTCIYRVRIHGQRS